jgi:hypothetical protein
MWEECDGTRAWIGGDTDVAGRCAGARGRAADDRPKRVTITADPRLLARFDGGAGRWRIAPGTYRIALGRAADDLILQADASLTGRLFGR